MGRITQLAGQESSGKTMLALSCIREYLNKNPENTALFIDAEYTYDPAWAEKQGVDTSRVIVIKTNDAKAIFEGLIGTVNVNKTTKKVSKSMKGILDYVIEGTDPRFKNLGIIVLDSIAVLNTPLELAAEVGKANMAPIPRFMSTELKKLTPVVAQANVAFIGINQVRVNLGQMFGDPSCVDPFSTKIKIKYNKREDIMPLVTEELTFFEFANRFLLLTDMETPNTFDISDLNIEIETQKDDGTIGFAKLDKFVIKKKVEKHYKLGDLRGSSAHRVLLDGEYVTLEEHPEAELVDEELLIVDVSVPETENYIANGQVNHNTSPGGKALKHACSLMLNMAPVFSAGSVIEDDSGERIGHTVRAKIEKNKVGAPFKQAEYKIEYQKGVVKTHEEVFDLGIEYGLIVRPNNQMYEIAGESIRGRDAAMRYFLENNLEADFLAKIKDAYIDGASYDSLDSGDDEEETFEENSLMGMIE